MTAEARVRVAITARHRPANPGERGAARETAWWVHEALAAACRAAGGLPLLLTAPLDGDVEAEASACIDSVDALILGGGGDISQGPDGQRLTALHAACPSRDRYEYALLRCARRAGKPVLGICRGAQLIQLAQGGALQPPDASGDALHVDPARYTAHGHAIEWLGEDASTGHRLWVNSAHRWRIQSLAQGLMPLARCPVDGSIEAFAANAGPWLRATLWHPEFMQESADFRLGSGLFLALIQATREL
ncbi:MAG: gamma-glutamyl-gamma-aminobutyrate hydrolase family protein [Lysobacterales bacterium]